MAFQSGKSRKMSMDPTRSRTSLSSLLSLDSTSKRMLFSTPHAAIFRP